MLVTPRSFAGICVLVMKAETQSIQEDEAKSRRPKQVSQGTGFQIPEELSP